jgi:hypothetical protein
MATNVACMVVLHIEFWWKNLEENRPSGITRCRRENIIKVDLKKQAFGMWYVLGWCVQSLGGKLE